MIEIVGYHRGGRRELVGPEAAARDRDRWLSSPLSVTVLHMDALAGEMSSLAQAVSAAVGTQVRSAGGLGAHASLSVRGAAPGHTAIVVDDIPLSRLGAATADLGRFQLGGLSEVEVYRGGTPTEMGASGAGGLHLRTQVGPGPDGERIVVSAGVGSLATRQLSVALGDTLMREAARGTVWLGYQGTRGDFSHFTDGGTPLNSSDDGWAVRRNNQLDQFDASARINGTGSREGVFGLRVGWRRQGLPGSTWQAARSASLHSIGGVIDGGFSTTVSKAHGAHRGYVALEQQRYSDPANEIGVGNQQRRYRSGSVGAMSSWRRDGELARRPLAWVAAFDVRADAYSDRDELAAQTATSGYRVGGAAALAAQLQLGTLTLAPGVRLEALRTKAPADLDRPLAMTPPPRWDTRPSPRVAALWRLDSDLALKAGAGGYIRTPTLLELYGDRGFVVGTPELRPEKGWSGDIGAVYAAGNAVGGFSRLWIEGVGFAMRSDDTIGLVTSLASVARPQNLGGAVHAGVEVSGGLRWRRSLSVVGNYTGLRTWQRSDDPTLRGRDLPRRPRHAANLRVDLTRVVRSRLFDVWSSFDWQASSFLDASGIQRVPGRILLAAGVKAELSPAWLVAFTVDNLLNLRQVALPLDPAPRPDLTSIPSAVSDISGFPLPGRTFSVQATWRH